MSATLALLRPRFLAVRNRWRRAKPGSGLRLALLGGLGVAFWIGVFVFFTRALTVIQGVPELGPVLAERLLAMLLLVFFSILLFSNVVTALSVFFLSADLEWLLATPVAPGHIHVARFAETLWDSSWMIILFGMPVLLAYGVVYDAGPAYLAAAVAVLGAFVMIPTALGASVTMLLVRSFPARRTKDVLLLLSVLGGAVLYLFLRMLQPEKLLEPASFTNFVDFLDALETPTSPYLPSTWASAALMPFLAPRPGQTPVFHLALLWSTAAAVFVVCEMIGERTYRTAWSRSQEGKRVRLTRLRIWDRSLALVPFISPAARAILLKDLKTFFRDTTQWSQLILLGALVVVYVYNFRVLPRGGAHVAELWISRMLSLLNFALAGFVVASVATRFAYPGVSLEGKAFWVLRTAPIRLRVLWWSKFASTAAPLVVLGLILVTMGNRALEIHGRQMWTSLGMLALMTASVTGLGLTLGAYFPRFDYENVAKIPSSLGGALFMVLAVLLIAANVVLLGWPEYVLLATQVGRRAAEAADSWRIVTCYAAAISLNLGVFALAARLGIRRLEALES